MLRKGLASALATCLLALATSATLGGSMARADEDGREVRPEMFRDHFEGGSLGGAWNPSDGGQPWYIWVGASEVRLRADGGSHIFPMIGRSDLFPGSGDFTIEVRFRYPGKGSLGTTIAVGSGPVNTYLRYPVDQVPASLEDILHIHKVHNAYDERYVVDILGGAVAWRGWVGDFDYHVVTLRLEGDLYSLYIDTSFIGSARSSLRPRSFYAGNPTWQPRATEGVTTWSPIDIDYVTVAAITRLWIASISPASPQDVGTTIAIYARMTTPVGVGRITLYYNTATDGTPSGSWVGIESRTPPGLWPDFGPTFYWDTSNVSRGTHLVVINGWDAWGNLFAWNQARPSRETQFRLVVPTLALTGITPPSPQDVGVVAAIAARMTSASGVNLVRAYYNTATDASPNGDWVTIDTKYAPAGTTDFSPTFTWNTAGVSPGRHLVVVNGWNVNGKLLPWNQERPSRESVYLLGTRAVGLSVSPPSPQCSGAQVTLRASISTMRGVRSVTWWQRTEYSWWWYVGSAYNSPPYPTSFQHTVTTQAWGGRQTIAYYWVDGDGVGHWLPEPPGWQQQASYFGVYQSASFSASPANPQPAGTLVRFTPSVYSNNGVGTVQAYYNTAADGSAGGSWVPFDYTQGLAIPAGKHLYVYNWTDGAGAAHAWNNPGSVCGWASQALVYEGLYACSVTAGISQPAEGGAIASGSPVALRGWARDSSYSIERVEVYLDGQYRGNASISGSDWWLDLGVLSAGGHTARARAVSAGSGRGAQGTCTAEAGVTFTVAPEAPGRLSPSGGACLVPSGIVLSWAAVPAASSYQVEVATDGAFANVVARGEAACLSWSTPPLSPGAGYYWRVRALNPGGAGPWSSAATFTVRPPAPSGLSPTGAIDGSEASLSWSGVVGATQYTVQVATDSAFQDLVVNTTTAGPSYRVTGLSPGATYYYRVQALAGSCPSDYSPAASFTTRPQAPGGVQPAGCLGVGVRSATFRWNAVPGTRLTYPWELWDEGAGQRVQSGTAASPQASVGSLLPSRRYQLRVYALADGLARSSGYGATSVYVNNPVVSVTRPAAGQWFGRGSLITVEGLALDYGIASGTGVDRVEVSFGGPRGSGAPVVVADYGLASPTAEGAYGGQYRYSGYRAAWTVPAGWPTGNLDIYVYARTCGGWAEAASAATVAVVEFAPPSVEAHSVIWTVEYDPSEASVSVEGRPRRWAWYESRGRMDWPVGRPVDFAFGAQVASPGRAVIGGQMVEGVSQVVGFVYPQGSSPRYYPTTFADYLKNPVREEAYLALGVNRQQQPPWDTPYGNREIAYDVVVRTRFSNGMEFLSTLELRQSVRLAWSRTLP